MSCRDSVVVERAAWERGQQKLGGAYTRNEIQIPNCHCLAIARESLLLEAGWAAIWLAAHPVGTTAPPALLLLRWQLFKASVLAGTAKLRLACGGAGGLADCFGRVVAAAAAPGRSSWLFAAALPPAAGGAALALVLAAQLPGAFLALSPFRGARLAAAALQLAAAGVAVATGAGGGAPALLLASLCVSLADDEALHALCTKGLLLSGTGAGKAAGGDAKAAGKSGGGGVQLTPINTGKGHARRDSFDELLASPRYADTPGAASKAGAAPACSLAAPLAAIPAWATSAAAHPAAAALLKPYAWAHDNPAPAAGVSVGVAAAAAAALLFSGGSSLSGAGAEALLSVALPLAALTWGLALARASAVSLQRQVDVHLSAAAAKPVAYGGKAAAVATPSAPKAAKGGARQAADALLSPPTSPRAGAADTPPTAAGKGRRVSKAAKLAAAPDGGDSDAGTPTARARGKKAAAAKDAGEDAAADAKAKPGKKAGAEQGGKGAAVPATPKDGGKASAKGAAAGGADGAAAALGWLRVAGAGAVTLAVLLTFLASVADSLWALPAGQQQSAR